MISFIPFNARFRCQGDGTFNKSFCICPFNFNYLHVSQLAGLPKCNKSQLLFIFFLKKVYIYMSELCNNHHHVMTTNQLNLTRQATNRGLARVGYQYYNNIRIRSSIDCHLIRASVTTKQPFTTWGVHGNSKFFENTNKYVTFDTLATPNFLTTQDCRHDKLLSCNLLLIFGNPVERRKSV